MNGSTITRKRIQSGVRNNSRAIFSQDFKIQENDISHDQSTRDGGTQKVSSLHGGSARGSGAISNFNQRFTTRGSVQTGGAMLLSPKIAASR